jgi:uncharacterized protein
MSATEEVVEEFIQVEDPAQLIPSKELCVSILETLKVPTASIAHADMVERVASHVARCIARRYPGRVNLDLVTAGAMLHEMGTVREGGLRYIMAGVGLARKLGLDPRLVEILRRHKGLAIGPVDAGHIGIPLGDLSIRTVEEWIVAHVDLLVVGDQRRSVQETVGSFMRAGRQEAAERILDSHVRLSMAAGCGVDKLGPTGEMECAWADDLFQGRQKTGRLLAVEDKVSVERKRAYQRTDGARWLLGAGALLLVILILAGRGGPTEDLWLLALMIGPFWLLWGVAKMEGPSHDLSGPVKVYENGIAMKSPEGEYSFYPWPINTRYYVTEVHGLGKVLTVPVALHSAQFLASMRDYDVVERVVKSKMVPDIRLSIWGPSLFPKR